MGRVRLGVCGRHNPPPPPLSPPLSQVSEPGCSKMCWSCHPPNRPLPSTCRAGCALCTTRLSCSPGVGKCERAASLPTHLDVSRWLMLSTTRSSCSPGVRKCEHESPPPSPPQGRSSASSGCSPVQPGGPGGCPLPPQTRRPTCPQVRGGQKGGEERMLPPKKDGLLTFLRPLPSHPSTHTPLHAFLCPPSRMPCPLSILLSPPPSHLPPPSTLRDAEWPPFPLSILLSPHLPPSPYPKSTLSPIRDPEWPPCLMTIREPAGGKVTSTCFSPDGSRVRGGDGRGGRVDVGGQELIEGSGWGLGAGFIEGQGG